MSVTDQARPDRAGAVRRAPMYGTRALADLVPLSRGASVVVAGRTRDLVTDLRHRGIEPQHVRAPRGTRGWSTKAAAGSHDAVVVAKACRRDPSVLHEAARMLRPGGWLVLGVRHQDWGRGRAATRTAALVHREATAAGFGQVGVYGVRSSMRSPRFVVPLDDPRAVRWFLRNVFLAETTLGAVWSQVVSSLPGTAAGGLLFRDLLIVARRHHE